MLYHKYYTLFFLLNSLNTIDEKFKDENQTM